MTAMNELTRKQFQEWGAQGGKANTPAQVRARKENGKHSSGRPKGSKDKAPRKRKTKKESQ